ncbi:serine hydrolase [Nocardia sp. CNY236]|uniref:serine hydrolase domain-containing protein n=1 Tax=Nocardia sp. CNY236 TaxID=1169152 RepID=UPI001E5D115E|nr:serine hydrolase domain-containing protein [Nocardia sp. CNY236]
MDKLVDAGAAGVQVRVRDGQEVWTGSAGVAEVGRADPVPVNGRFRAGSVTKTFVATVVLQLVDEGRLRLEDSVAAHMPRFGLDPRITVRMILQHTSGLFDYTGELDTDGSIELGLLPTSGPEVLEAAERPYPPDELVRFALSKPARFAPGAGWSYSNTNYILAGLLIEKLTGLPYAVQIYSRIVVPLGLWGTVVPGPLRKIPGPHAHGYVDFAATGDPRAADVTDLPVTWVWSAGEIISTTEDLDTFLTALLTGRLLPPPLLAEMLDGYSPEPTTHAYGLGLEKRELTSGCRGIGHSGDVPGYYGEMIATADGSRSVVVSITTGPTTDGFDPRAVAELHAFTTVLVTKGLCHSVASFGVARDEKRLHDHSHQH